MGRHVLSDVVVIFGLEQLCVKALSSRLGGWTDQLRRGLEQRPEMFDVSSLSAESLNERVAGYEPQATALSTYFLMSLPAAVRIGR